MVATLRCRRKDRAQRTDLLPPLEVVTEEGLALCTTSEVGPLPCAMQMELTLGEGREGDDRIGSGEDGREGATEEGEGSVEDTIRNPRC